MRPSASASTMWPRWTLSSMPLRTCGRGPGGGGRGPSRRLVARPVVRRGRDARRSAGGPDRATRSGLGSSVASWAPRLGHAALVRRRQPRRTGTRYDAGLRRVAPRRSPDAASGPRVDLPATSTCRSHPAVRHKLGILRDETTEPKKFREVVRELSWLLGYEALADARLHGRRTVKTPLETMRATSSPTGSGSSRSCGRAWGWSTRCSS